MGKRRVKVFKNCSVAKTVLRKMVFSCFFFINCCGANRHLFELANPDTREKTLAQELRSLNCDLWFQSFNSGLQLHGSKDLTRIGFRFYAILRIINVKCLVFIAIISNYIYTWCISFTHDIWNANNDRVEIFLLVILFLSFL